MELTGSKQFYFHYFGWWCHHTRAKVRQTLWYICCIVILPGCFVIVLLLWNDTWSGQLFIDVYFSLYDIKV